MMNRNILLLMAAAAGLCACNGGQGYTIEGPADDEGYAVLSIMNVEGATLHDTTDIKDGKFVFKGAVNDVYMGDVVLFIEGRTPESNFLYVENSHLVLRDGKFYGGPNNDFMRDMDAVGAGLDTLAHDYQQQLKNAMNACFISHPDVEAAAFMYYVFNRETPLDEYEAGFNKFTERVQNSALGKNGRDEIIARQATGKGTVAPVFTLKDREGNPISLESLRGKYVLLDFWASWCRPCRASMPRLKEIYSEYHDKGLEILGISIDTDADAWQKAVTDDALPWLHVIDEREEERGNSLAASLYGVHAVPTLFLIDPSGIMIGQIDHDDLDTRLQGVF